MKFNLALIRCGKTQSGLENKYISYKDEPLLPDEKERLQSLSKRYPEVTLVYTGELQRCRETAACIYKDVPHIVTRKLQPPDIGKLEGVSKDNISTNRELLEWFESDDVLTYPEGESLSSFSAKCQRVVRDIVNEMGSKGIESTAVVTHNEVISAIMQRYCIPRSIYRDWTVAWGCGYWVEFDSCQNVAKIISRIRFLD